MPKPVLSTFLRWLDVFLRGAHLVSIVLLGSAILGAPVAAGLAGAAVLASGVAMLITEVWNRPELLRQWTGLSLLLKLALVGWMLGDGTWRAPLFWLIVGWSAIFAHAPSTFRHRRWCR
jgi:hypothetical protein